MISGLSRMMSFDESRLVKNRVKNEPKSVDGPTKTKLRASSSAKMELSTDLLRSEGSGINFWALYHISYMIKMYLTYSSKAIEICSLFIKKKLNRMIGNFFRKFQSINLSKKH